MFTGIYEGSFASKRDIAVFFEFPIEEIEDCEILYANYSAEGYEGYSFVLFIENGKLYEVNGSHCSCHGLEGQWEPEETTIEELQFRLERGNLGYAIDASSLKQVIDYLSGERDMRDMKITTKMEFTPEDVKQILADYVKRQFGLVGDVSLNVGIEYPDNGFDRSASPVFKNAVFTNEREMKG